MKRWLYKNRNNLVGPFVLSEVFILVLIVICSALNLNLLAGISLILLLVNSILLLTAMLLESHFIDNKDKYFDKYCRPLTLREVRLKKIKKIERHPILTFFKINL